jgi:hypothetical protein
MLFTQKRDRRIKKLVLLHHPAEEELENFPRNHSSIQTHTHYVVVVFKIPTLETNKFAEKLASSVTSLSKKFEF